MDKGRGGTLTAGLLLAIVTCSGSGSTAVASPRLAAAPQAAAGGVQVPRIAFQRSAEESQGSTPAADIYTVAPDGSDLTQLTDHPAEDEFPAYSPDGEHIAFASTRTGRGDIYVMDAGDGSDLQRITRGPVTDALPTWSPNQRFLIFTRSFDTQSDLFKVRLSDGRVTRLTDTPKIQEFAPAWSPDGSQVAFTRLQQGKHRFGVGRIEPNGSGVGWIVINPASDEGLNDFNPAWSADSERVAFSREHGYEVWVDIFSIRPDGSGLEQVTALEGLAENPTWSPDGPIAFAYNRGIAVVEGDGTGLRTITPQDPGHPTNNAWPDWALEPTDGQ